MDLAPITFTCTDGSSFTLQPSVPASMMARYDLLTELAQHRNNHGAQAQRVVLAGLGMTLTGKAPEGKATLPVYRMDGNITVYGGIVGDHLLRSWGISAASMGTSIYPQAQALSLALIGSLPTEEGVKARADFTSASAEASTG